MNHSTGGSDFHCSNRMGNLCTSCPCARTGKEDPKPQSPKVLSVPIHKNDLTRKVVKKKAIQPEPRLPTLECTSAVVTNQPKTAADRALILKVLRCHLLFAELEEESRELALGDMRHFSLHAGEYVYREGARAANFFILACGAAEVLEKERKVREIQTGEGFGDAALLHDTKRMASVRTTTNCGLWGLERKAFRRFMAALSAQHYEENSAFVESIGLFTSLTIEQRLALVQCMHPAVYLQGQCIVKEGDTGDWLYVIKDGEVLCTQGTKELRRMHKGDFFGEQALLYGGVRTASVTAASIRVKCLYISAKDLTLALGDCMQNIIYVNTLHIALEKKPAFASLLPSQLMQVVRALRIESFDSGTVVLSAGTALNSGVWVVLKGSLRVNGATTIYAETFSCLGLHSTEVVETDIVVATDIADVAWMTREELEQALGGPLDQAVSNNEALECLRRVQLLRLLPTEKLTALIHVFRLREYADKQTIVQQGSSGDAFFIIKSGTVEIVKDETLVRQQTKWDYFGERSVLFSENRSATVRAKGEVVCCVLGKEDFAHIIQPSLRAQLVRRIELQDTSVRLQDLVFVRVLGRGMFGLVVLVAHTTHKTLFALKSVPRSKVQLYDLHSNLMQERKIMLQLDHSLIIKLIRTFKDSDRVYFLLEYVSGLDFFDVLRLMGLVSNEDARFYTAALVTVLDYLHSRDIVYRDLKPENVLIDEEGYPKLIDFGTAKIVANRTYSVVGTPHYMAPEVIMGQGYGPSTDYWSLGVVLYEMICGEVPFAEDQEDPYVIYEQILERQLAFPSFLEPRLPAKVMIDQLLSVNPGARTQGSIDKLKRHRWFRGFDWEKLESRELLPPYVPSAEGKKGTAGRKDLGTVLRTEEKEEELPPSRSESRNRPAPPPDWDGEF